MPDTKRKQKPTVSIIGAGRLGTTLAVALSRKGYSIESLVARHAQTARKAAGLKDEQLELHQALRALLDGEALR